MSDKIPVFSRIVEEIMTRDQTEEAKKIEKIKESMREIIPFSRDQIEPKIPPEFNYAYKDIILKEGLLKMDNKSSLFGDYKLRELIATVERNLFSLKGLNAGNIIIGSNPSQLFYELIFSLMDPGEGVYLFDPSNPFYMEKISLGLRESSLIYHPILDIEKWEWMPSEKEAIEMSSELIEKYQPKIAVISVPDNPTSRVPSDGFIKSLLKTMEEVGGFLIIDYNYKTQLFEESFPSYYSLNPQDHRNLIAINSKSIWSIGPCNGFSWIEASEEAISILKRIREISGFIPNIIQQIVMRKYFETHSEDKSYDKYLKNTQNLTKTASRTLTKEIKNRLGFRVIEPDGGIYTVMNVNMDSIKFTKEVLLSIGVSLTPGRDFGETLKEGVRLSVGSFITHPERLQEAVERLENYLKRRGII